jgi:hypothetical protein
MKYRVENETKVSVKVTLEFIIQESKLRTYSCLLKVYQRICSIKLLTHKQLYDIIIIR